MSTINPALLKMAQRRILLEKKAVVPPPGAGAGAPPSDPAAAGGAAPPGAAPAGGAPAAPPPMDPSMMGGMPPGGMPGMPPGMPPGGMPGMMPGMPPGGMPGAAAPPKMKPEQMMMMLDFRMYNLQQQMTAIMNAFQIKLPPGALVLPPGSPVAPPAESALPGGPQDPAQSENGGGGGESAISPVEPMQGASPELAQGGGQKMAADLSFAELLNKMAEDDFDAPRKSSPPQPLRGAHPGKRPSTQAISAGGSKDPLSRTELSDDDGPANAKSAAQVFGSQAADLIDQGAPPKQLGSPFEPLRHGSPVTNGAATAALLRSRTAAGVP